MTARPSHTNEYACFWLACREETLGVLPARDRDLAAEEIVRGRLLLRRGYLESGFTERYVGGMHQLRGEYAEAIPYLVAARGKLFALDKVAADRTLFVSYMETGDVEKARRLALHRVERSGPYAGLYRRLLETVPSPSEGR